MFFEPKPSVLLESGKVQQSSVGPGDKHCSLVFSLFSSNNEKVTGLDGFNTVTSVRPGSAGHHEYLFLSLGSFPFFSNVKVHGDCLHSLSVTWDVALSDMKIP